MTKNKRRNISPATTERDRREKTKKGRCYVSQQRVINLRSSLAVVIEWITSENSNNILTSLETKIKRKNVKKCFYINIFCSFLQKGFSYYVALFLRYTNKFPRYSSFICAHFGYSWINCCLKCVRREN